MAEGVLMPKAGITVESCVIGEWKKNVGDQVAVGDILFTYETDKAEFECESTAAGTLLAQFYAEGDEVPCLVNVCAVGTPGEDVEALRNAAPAAEAPAAPAAAAAAAAAPAAAVKPDGPCAQAVIMPKEGITVESCIIGEWKKNVGDAVAVGDVLFTYETDKAEFECPSTAAGTLLAKFFEDGARTCCGGSCRGSTRRSRCTGRSEGGADRDLPARDGEGRCEQRQSRACHRHRPQGPHH